jgi:hypothetical protein
MLRTCGKRPALAASWEMPLASASLICFPVATCGRPGAGGGVDADSARRGAARELACRWGRLRLGGMLHGKAVFS